MTSRRRFATVIDMLVGIQLVLAGNGAGIVGLTGGTVRAQDAPRGAAATCLPAGPTQQGR